MGILNAIYIAIHIIIMYRYCVHSIIIYVQSDPFLPQVNSNDYYDNDSHHIIQCTMITVSS